MRCLDCGGDMHGDGYHLVLVCEFYPEDTLCADDGPEYAAPDEGPFYCDSEEEEEEEEEVS